MLKSFFIGGIFSLFSTIANAQFCTEEVADGVEVTYSGSEFFADLGTNLFGNAISEVGTSSSLVFTNDGIRIKLSWNVVDRTVTKLFAYEYESIERIGEEFTVTFYILNTEESRIWQDATLNNGRVSVVFDGSGVALELSPVEIQIFNSTSPKERMRYPLGSTRSTNETFASFVYENLSSFNEVVFQYVSNFQLNRIGEVTFDKVETIRISRSALSEALNSLETLEGSCK